jgi:DNA-binding CsgD family transcriptional regulator/N-acetylneuraminic acid mutarotase
MPEHGEPLTEREKEILRLVATGVTNRQVGHRLGISVNTVKVHLRNVFTKLGAESRTEATMIAVQEGWVAVEGANGALGVIEGPELEGENGAARVQVPPIAPEPPLPAFKRVALIAALLLVVAGVATTWPRNRPVDETGPNLPLDRPQQQPPAVLPETADLPWHEQAQMPTRRAYLALAVAGDRVIALGGRTPEGITAAVETYDPEDDLWARGTDKPTPVVHISAAVIGADVYVPGGCDADGTPTQVVEVYDALADSWREINPLPEPRCAYALTAWGGRVFLFGGWDGEQYTATAYVYDPQADTWAETTPMHMRQGFAAATSLGDHLYVVGGYDGERELTTCAVYDPATETWAACAPLAVGRGGLGLASSGGQIYAIGGGGWTSYLGFNERYNPLDDAWSPIETPLVGEWRSPGVIVFETAIYAIGGWNGDYLSLNQVYEPLPFRIFIPGTQQQ